MPERDAGDRALAPSERPAAQLADWRFLLAPPSSFSGRFAQAVVLGGPAGVVPRLRAAGIADRVTTTLDGAARADAIVILPPAQPDPALLRATIAGHGQLYLERDRALTGGGGGTLGPAVLRRHGFAIDGTYAVPPLDQPRRYVPLDDARMLRWYFARMYRSLTPLQSVAAHAVPLFGSLGVSGATLARLARTVAIVARPADAPPRRSLAVALAHEVVARDVVPWMLLIGDGGDRVVLLPFARDEGDAPAAVLKVPRTTAFESRTEGEQARVREIRALLPEQLRSAVPEPLALTRAAGFLVAAERCARGRSMLVSSGRAGASRHTQRRDLITAMHWLVRFHQSTMRERITLRDAREFLLEQPITAFDRHFGASSSERALFEITASHAAGCSASELPISRTHGDFAVWNLLRDGDDIAVTDWEGSSVGMGYGDALHLVTSWDIAVRRPANAEAERHCFAHLFLHPDRHDEQHRTAMRALADYRGVMGIDERLAPLLLLHHQLELALRRARQQADAGELLTDRRASNRPAGLVALLASERARLFATPSASPLDKAGR